MSHWICGTCKKPIARFGYIELINTNEDLGRVGEFPKLRTPDLERAEGTSPLFAAVERTWNVGVLVYHQPECDPHPETEGYSIDIRRAQTLERWCAWVMHLSEKSWIGRDDLRRLLEFWWTHNGGKIPSA